jgi:hypothetical protein
MAEKRCIFNAILRSCELHLKAEHMAAPTNAANLKKALANSEPSTHGTQQDDPGGTYARKYLRLAARDRGKDSVVALQFVIRKTKLVQNTEVPVAAPSAQHDKQLDFTGSAFELAKRLPDHRADLGHVRSSHGVAGY